MKICPTCNEHYQGEAASFCLKDGTALVVEDAGLNTSDLTPFFPYIVVFGIVGVLGFVLLLSGQINKPKAGNSFTKVNTNLSSNQEVSNAMNAMLMAANRMAQAANAAASQSSSLPGKRALVISENANLRKSDNPESDVVVVIPINTNLEWIEQRGAWFSVKFNGKFGWMHGNTIRLLPPTTTVIDTAPKASSDTMRKIYEECARQQNAYGDRSPLCDDVERNGIP